MKNLAFTILVVLTITASHGAIFRIGLPGGSTTGVDFPISNIAGAISAASAGDTIQMYQQYWASSPGTVTVAKPLKFIGFGHTLDKTRGLQAVSSADNRYVDITFNSGSGGSVVTGVYCGLIQIATSNITITRSKFNNYIYLINNSVLSNITVTDCFITANSGYTIIESGSSSVTNLYVANNIMLGYTNLPNSTGIFANNYVNNSTCNLYSFLVRNNIFYSTFPAANSNSFAYNIFSGNYASNVSGTGNVFNVNLANTFVNWNSGTIAVDTQLVLKPTTSPALGAGKNNANNASDCGIFGGEAGEEYIISGIPPVPAIYQLSAPSQTATGSAYNITVSIRSNK